MTSKIERQQPPAIVMAITVDEVISLSIAHVTLTGIDQLRSLTLRADELEQVLASRAPFEVALRFLFARENVAKVIDDVKCVVISSIGLVSGPTRQIIAVARNGWPGFTPSGLPIDLTVALCRASPTLATKLTREPGTADKTDTLAFEVFNDMTSRTTAELRFGMGSAKQVAPLNEAFAYIRLGAGINAGILLGGLPWRGGLHPEVGHLKVRRDFPSKHNLPPRLAKWAAGYKGNCHYHRDCIEGLVSESALLQRWRVGSIDEVLSNAVAVDVMAREIAYLCANLVMLVAPDQISVGGTLATSDLVKRLRFHFTGMIRDYPDYTALRADNFITRAKLLDAKVHFWGAAELARMRHYHLLHVRELVGK